MTLLPEEAQAVEKRFQGCANFLPLMQQRRPPFLKTFVPRNLIEALALSNLPDLIKDLRLFDVS